MAISQIYFSNSGVPATGLTPVFSSLKKVSDGTDVTPPSITAIGGGWYKFDINPTEKLVGVIDGGVSLIISSERYMPVYFDVYDYLYSIIVVPTYDENTDSIKFMVLTLQNGKVRDSGLTNCDLTIYNSSHIEQFNINSSSQTNGVFVINKSNPALIKNIGYYVIAEVTLDGVVHTSIDTYFSLE